jgi:diamine N-acetyltransferase
MINLRKVTQENFAKVWLLKADENLVAPNSLSLAEAYVYGNEFGHDKIIARVIYNDDIVVGFIMIKYDCDYGIDNKGESYFYLERFMIDEKYQNNGYGKKALAILIDELKAGKHGKATAFYTGYEVDNPITPRLYQSMGFVPTGEELEDDGDVELVVRLSL